MSKYKTINFDMKLILDNDIEVVKAMISFLYLGMNLSTDDSSKPSKLSLKMLDALAIYVIHGYSSDSKVKLMKSLGFEHDYQINTLNKQLRTVGLMYKDRMNDRISHLHPKLQALSECIKVKKENNIDNITFRLNM